MRFAKKEIAAVVAALKADHKAEDAAPLLGLKVDQFNKILYGGREQDATAEDDAAGPERAADADASGSAASSRPPMSSDDEETPGQFTLLTQTDTPASSPSSAASGDSQS